MTKNPVAYAIAPLLSVRSGKRALGFYKEAFGAVETFKVEDPGGAIVARTGPTTRSSASTSTSGSTGTRGPTRRSGG